MVINPLSFVSAALCCPRAATGAGEDSATPSTASAKGWRQSEWSQWNDPLPIFTPNTKSLCQSRHNPIPNMYVSEGDGRRGTNRALGSACPWGCCHHSGVEAAKSMAVVAQESKPSLPHTHIIAPYHSSPSLPATLHLKCVPLLCVPPPHARHSVNSMCFWTRHL